MRLLSAIAFLTLFAVAISADAAPLAAPHQVDIPSGNAILHAQLYKPEGEGPFPVVIALHGCGGLGGRSEPVQPRYRDWAEQLLKGRVQVINLWRPIRGPLRDSPLAMVDGTTVAPDDLVASDLIYPNRRGETYSVKYNPNHRWFYFPEMTADEALLLKCYDSLDDGRTRFGPHTAFTDPTTPVDAAPRESIELRALVFHKA